MLSVLLIDVVRDKESLLMELVRIAQVSKLHQVTVELVSPQVAQEDKFLNQMESAELVQPTNVQMQMEETVSVTPVIDH